MLQLFDGAVKTFGRVDVLFDNAGVNAPGIPLEDLMLAQWKNVVDINLTGMFLCIQQAFRVMKAQALRGGRIVNNGSISAHTPTPNSIDYTATKHGVMGLTKTTSFDGRKYDIAVGQSALHGHLPLEANVRFHTVRATKMPFAGRG